MGKYWKNVKIIGFLDIFWNILNKMKYNLIQECAKGGLLSFQGKIGTISPDFPGKNDIFSGSDPTFPPIPLSNLAVSPTLKLYF